MLSSHWSKGSCRSPKHRRLYHNLKVRPYCQKYHTCNFNVKKKLSWYPTRSFTPTDQHSQYWMVFFHGSRERERERIVGNLHCLSQRPSDSRICHDKLPRQDTFLELHILLCAHATSPYNRPVLPLLTIFPPPSPRGSIPPSLINIPPEICRMV